LLLRAFFNSMSLPILNHREEADDRRLLRLAGQARSRWMRHLGEESQWDVGVAVVNAELVEGNCVVDVALPDGCVVDEVIRAVEAHFAGAGTSCRKWSVNPSATLAQTQPIANQLVSRGYTAERWDVLHLRRPASVARTQAEPVTVIPARASYRHVQELFDGGAAALVHLDDPHTDAVLALRDGRAAGYVAVLAMGEVGLIEDLYVMEGNRGLATVMMNRAVEICARSQFRHVFTCVRDGETTKHLIDVWGFAKIGDAIDYLAPA
jgi:hypothetical protein